MSTNRSNQGWVSRGLRWAALVLVFGLAPLASGQASVGWRGEAVNGNWWNDPHPWWYGSYSEDRPDRPWQTANNVSFNNNVHTTMDLNGNDWYYIRELVFSGSATSARTMNRSGSAGIDMRGSGTRKIENNSSAHHVFNVPVSLVDGTTEFNPVSGDLTFNSTVYLANNWIEVYGDNAHYLYLNGVVDANSGSGGIAVKQNSIVVLTNANTFTGGLWVEKGTVQLNTRSNAMGTGTVNVGTNATLDLQYGTANLQPVTLNLYGTGTNAAWGALRKNTTGTTGWRGGINLGADSRIVVTAGGLGLYGAVAAGTHTLYISNTAGVIMYSSSSLTGSKTTGDGALHKSGSSYLTMRQAAGLTGSVILAEGEIRQTADNSSTLPAGGVLSMAAGTLYSSDGTGSRTIAKNMAVNGHVGLAFNSSGGLEISGNVNLGGGTRILTNLNDVAVTGVISNGGLTKAGSGTMTLSGANTYSLGTLVSAGALEGTTSGLQGNITNHSALVFTQTVNGTYSGVISGTGTLAKRGSGTVTLSGANTYSGNTTVSAGTLLVSGSAGSSAFTVSSGATLAGAGTVGNLTVNGTVSPGNASGARATLSCGSLSLGSGGAYTFDISNVSGAAGTDWDLVSGSGVLTVNPTGTFTIYATGNPTGFDSGSSYAWTILSGSSVSGFNAARFAVNTGAFTPGLDGGAFSVAQSGANLQLVFTPAAPPTPADLTASDGTSTAHVALSWSDVARETGYVVWRHTADLFASATAIRTNAADATTYDDTSATPGQLYYYWVTATNTGGASAESTSDSGYRKLAEVPILAATDGDHLDRVALTWTDIEGETGYGIWRHTADNSAAASWLANAVANATSYNDTSATPGQLYYYWVRATNSTSSSQSDFQASGEDGYRKLPVVSGVAATTNLTAHVQVTWTDSDDGETGYTVWRHTADVSGSAVLISGAALGADETSYNDSSATAGTPYYYWVRATNSTSQSLSDFSASAEGLRLLSEPTLAASNITFNALVNDAMTVNWERGDGNYVLVVARQGAAPDDPTDSTVYDADAAFGFGDITGAGSFVVYKGTGTSVPVTGLSTATEYTFAVYEFNGAALPNYRTSDEPVETRSTLVAGPSVQATNITISGIFEVSMTGIDWTDGDGTSRLLVMKAAGAVDSFPVDGTTYSYSTNFGSGSEIGTGNYVVWAGAGRPERISSLDRDVIYHFRVFEFNGSAGTENYLTNAVAGNPISQTTMAGVPGSSVADLALSAIGSNQFTITWTKTGTNTLVLVKTGGISTGPTSLNSYTADPAFGAGSEIDGAFVVYNGTGESVVVTGLTPGTLYYVRAYPFNGGGGSENYRLTSSANTSGRTLMGEPTQAAGIAFSSLGDTSYAVSYTAGNGLSRLVVAKAGGAVDWFPADGTDYAGENNDIGLAADLGTGNYLVHRGASPFTLSGLSAATDYHIRIYEYQGTNTTLNYNTNAASGNPSNRYALSTQPSAHAATFTATAVSDTEIDLDWGAATGESGFVIVRRAGAAPTGTPANGVEYTQGDALGDGTVVHVATAAGADTVTDSTSTAAGTTYYYRIYPYAYDGTPAHATYHYRTAATVPSDSATTGPAEPATSSTLVSFLPASGSSATVIWTNTGTAAGTIILVKSNAAVDASPADWTGYTADTVFGDGDELGTGNYVVLAAAGSHGSVTVTGLSAGSTYHVAVFPYNGTGSFLNYRTASPATGSVILLPDPSAATATADGKTLIDLAWTKDASYDVMIVHRTGSPSTPPTQGTGYSVGDSVGGGTVIHKGAGAALEHVVASGTAHYYAFYSYNGSDYYSAGVTDSDSTTSFAADEVAETFSYTNSTALTGLNGETGWGGGWYGADIGLFTNSSGSFTEQTNYPAPSGNKLWVYPPENTEAAVFRPLGQDYSSGTIYFGYVVNYTWAGANKYAGLSLFWTNTNEKLFIGEIYGQDQQLGIDSTGSSYTLTAGSGNDYIIVGYYDWAAGEAKAKAYKIGTQAVPSEEPSTWDVTVSKASNTVGTVDTIRLAAGAGATDGTPGNTYFDEVRIATNWSDLIGVLPTKPEWPTNQTVTADGSEMVRLAWTTNSTGHGVMILHKTSAISTDPTDGTGYSPGDTIDGATVIVKTNGAALEHVVTPGTTNHYAFYSYSGANYYSTGVVASATNEAYSSFERVNPFSYTNSTALGASTVGGQGFGGNAWSVNSGTWQARTNNAVAAADVPMFMNMDGYPDMAGNLAWVADPGNGGSATADRNLASGITTGNFYVAFMMSYQYYGANKWAGLSLMNGGTEKAFFGKGAGGNWSTLAAVADGSTYWSSFDLLPFDSTGGDTGNVYMVVGHYNFESQLLRTKAWKIIGSEFPGTEPSTWDASGTLGTGIDEINRIRLNVGSSDGGATIGRVFFDEIRYGTSWSDLLAVTCPTWAGSNTLNNAEWTAPESAWLGDTESFQFQSFPVGLGQSGGIEFDWGQDGSFSTYHDLPWLQNANSNSYWSNQLQMVSAGDITSRYVAAGTGCAEIRTNNPVLSVQNLNAPSNAVVLRDGVNTNSQINLTWDRGDSGGVKDTLVIRQTVDFGWTAPVDGTTYNAGDALGTATVVYRGAGTSFDDAGLAPNTTYYYRFYAENWTYYSTAYDADSDSTAPGGQVIVIDGNPVDWLGTAPTVINSAGSSLQEFIWTDKRGDVRTDSTNHPNADVSEFRVYADADWVYVLVRMTNITDVSLPFVAIGVDTRTNSASTAMNWLGDDSATFIGDGYSGGSAAAHYPEYQINVHQAGGTTYLEAFAHDGSSWYAPPTGGNTNAAMSATHNAMELKVARADLNLSGATTARFTVASFLNTGSWNNEGGGTVTLTAGTSHAADALSIPPWNLTDNTLSRSAWEEDISDGDIDFWLDVKFGAAGLVDNTRPAVPVLVTPTNNADTIASPTLIWNSSTDSDGQVTGYLLEISTNDQFNGVSGSENGGIELRVNLDAATTNYTFTTTSSQYWWRVRARDTAGHLSTATTRAFRVVGKLDTEGPQPTLLYIGTNVTGFLAGDYDDHISKYGYIQDVWDSEIRDTNNVFGFVLRWEDPSGVYATNRMRSTDSPPEAGGFAYNIVDTDGRVSPNWDLIEVDTMGGTTNDLWGVDKPFHATNTLAAGNTDTVISNYVHTAFNVTNYNPDIEYYLTVSAEDGYSEGGSWWEYGSWPSFTNSSASEPYYSGWCEDGPNTARNITTNFLIRINVVDDDPTPPVPGTALGWANSASLVISNATVALDYVEGSGLDVLYEITDGDLVGEPLSFVFNAYDNYFKGVTLGTAATFVDEGRTLTNTSFVVESWTTNWANYAVAMSDVTDTTSNTTMMTWHWGTLTTNDITALWGNDDLSGTAGITNQIQLNLFDVDNDRAGDQASALVSFGRLRVVDDDPDPPVIADMQVLGTGLASEYRLENLVQWTFDGSDPSRLTSTNVASGVTSSPVSLDTGTIIGTDVITVSAGFSTGAERSWLFNLTPASTTETFKASSISFDSRVSSLNGPDTIEIFGTMPSGSETLWATVEIDLSDPDEPVGTNWNGYSTSLTMPAAATNTTQFRIKAHVADTNHLTGTGNATWSIDNLVVSGYILGELGGTQVTDHDLAEGTVRFEASLHDAFSGLYATTQSGRAPRVDFWHADGVPLTNVFFTNGLTADGDATSATTVWGYAPAADKQDIQAGPVPTNHSARFTTDDYDTDRGSDELQTLDVLADVPVYDNDTNAPVRGFKYGSPLGVFVDDTITKAVSSGFTREYRINDEQLQTAAATSITVKINLYDFSGWEVPELTFSNSVGGLISTNGWLEDLHTASVDTTNNPDAEMVWTLTKAQADTFFDTYESVVNVFRISSVWDKDDDRHDALDDNIDRRELANARIGHLTFLDNDVGQPNLQSSWSVARTNWNVPAIYLGDSGDLFASNVLINADVAMPSTNSAADLAIMTNRVYDSQLADVSADAPMSVVLPAFDTGGGGAGRTVKGVQRGTTLTQESVNTGYDITNTWIGIGTVVVQNASAYDPSLSSSEADTRIAARFPTSTWSFTSFSYAEVGHWLNEGSSTQTHALSSGLYDADDNRPLDQTLREVPFGTLLVLDNDTVAPVAPTNLTVNGVAAGGGFTRFTAPWTNQPGFRIGFEPSVDGEPAGTDLEKTGIGEHRVATQRSDIGPDLGVPLAVPAESSLANYGFESGSTNWALTGAEISTEQAYEGLYSLKMTGSTAVQTVRLFNTNGYAPRVTVLGAQFMGAETGTVTIAGLDAAGDPVVGETFDVEIAGSAGIWQSDSSAPTELDASVDRIRVTLTSGAGTYWDDIRVQIELLNAGTPVDETAALHVATDQGLVTNFLFAVDRDNNRPGDRRASSAPLDPVVPEFVTAYDITPPTPVSMPADAASTDFVEDPTTQFDLEWTVAGVGPDDEADTNYPSGYSGTDVLSPWRTYKIYYATFDPMDVPGGDPGHGSTNAYMYTNFIATGVYTNWASVVSTNAIADPSAAGTNYLTMANLNQSTIRLYDLETDYDYMVVVAGLDRAGNEGPAAMDGWATNNTVRFSVTSGWTVAKSFARAQFGPDVATNTAASNTMALGWTAAGIKDGIGDVSKHYDLIYWNNSWEGFQESSNNTWQLVSNVKSNWFVDDAGQFKGRGQIRFYRAAQSNRWNKAQFSRPQASEEVYALHNVILSEGYNYVGLHGVPYTNTFAGVFGTDTNLWPAGASLGAGATKVEFYQAGTNVVLTETYWFGTDGNWYPTNSPTPVTHDLQASNFFTRGFSVTLPKPLPAMYHTTNALDNLQPGTNIPAMVWSPIMQVPTNAPGGGGFSHVIHCGVRGGTGTGQWRTNVYNLVSLNLPVGAHPHDMRLIESGFEPAASDAERLNGDHIYFVDTSRKAVGGTKTIYCDGSLLGGSNPKSAWKFLDGGPVPDAYFKPNDMIVIVSKNGGLGSTWTWNYHPTNFYTLPTRFMGW